MSTLFSRTFAGILLAHLSIATWAQQTPNFGQPPAWENAVRLGNAAIQNQLIDPESARIEWPYTLIGGSLTPPRKPTLSGWYTCGWVNAKNRMGGYAGREPFLIMFQSGQPILVEIGGRSGSRMAEATCADLASKGWLKSSGLEALGAMKPGDQPNPELANQTFQTVADAAYQNGGAGLSYVPSPAGAVIMAVAKGSPADKANLKPGQVIEEVDGISIEGMEQLALNAVLAARGKRVQFKVIGVGSVIVTRGGE